MSVGLKVCGITRAEDFDACERAGVEAIGLNFWEGSKRRVSLEQARELCAGRTRGPLRVGVFVDPDAGELRKIWDGADLDFVQLHGDAPIENYAFMRIPYVWVIRGTPALTGLVVPTPPPAWILLDAAVEGFGGAGHRTDWSWARGAVKRLAPIPFWLAGGITTENAAEAIEAVEPAGLDVASGVEFPGAQLGEKDAAKIASLARICKNERSP